MFGNFTGGTTAYHGNLAYYVADVYDRRLEAFKRDVERMFEESRKEAAEAAKKRAYLALKSPVAPPLFLSKARKPVMNSRPERRGLR